MRARQPCYKAYIGRVGSKLEQISGCPVTWPYACLNGCKYSIIIKNIISFGRMQISVGAELAVFWLSLLGLFHSRWDWKGKSLVAGCR
jgi:hypothetical protein